MNKTIIYALWSLCFLYPCLLFGQTLSPRIDIDRSDCLQIPKARDSDIAPFTNTIKTYGNGVLELYTPPVGNQGYQGSCTGWAFGYGCASIQAYEMYQDWNWARRSPSFLFNHKQVNCEGADWGDVLDLLRDTGVCSYYLMPYDENNCETLPDPNSIQYADAMLNRSTPLSVSLTDVLEYKQYLQIGHPIGVVTNYAKDLKRVWNNTSLNGLWNSVVNTSTDSLHAMCIIGYDDNQQLFKVMNSWDSIKGDNGFVWVSYDLVENGIFSAAYVFRADTSGFVPQIQGSTYFCGTEECYAITNVPVSCTHSWSISSNFNPGDTIVSGNGTSSICIREKNGYIPMREELLSPNFPRSVIKDTIRDANNNQYIVSKAIYNPTPRPTISASDTAQNWIAGQNRTFTISNNIPSNQVKWTIKKTRKEPLTPPEITYSYAYGQTLDYTPTWPKRTLSMTIKIFATNTGRECTDSVTSLPTYTIVRPASITGIVEDDVLTVSLTDGQNGDSLSQLQQRITDNNATYTLELWHTMYGRMRVQEVRNENEQINTTGLPQGVYVVLLKENGTTSAQKKIMVK